MFVPNLQWLDADDPEAGKKARAHRQKEFHRAKRWKQTQQFREERETARKWLGKGQQPPSGPQPVKTKGSKTGSKTEIPLHFKQFDPATSKYTGNGGQDVVATSLGRCPTEDKKKQSGRRLKKEKIHPGKIQTEGILISRSKERTNAKSLHSPDGPWIALATSRRDPFASASLPGNLTDREHCLVDYYLRDYGRIVYNTNESFIHKEVWFPLARTGPMAFQAMAIYESARLFARCQGMRDTPETNQLKQRTIQAIQQHLDSPLISVRTNDEVMTAVLSVAHSENHFGLKETAAAHFRAVMAMVRQRGGPDGVDTNHRLGIFTNWVNYLTITPQNLLSQHHFSFSPNSPHLPDTCNSLTDLLVFLNRTTSLARTYYQTSRRHQMRRRILFNLSSPIYNILRLPPGYDQWSYNLIPVYARVAALFHIHAALWEFRDKPGAMERYLDSLEIAGGECAYNVSCSIGVFVHHLLKIDYDESDRQASLSSATPTSASKLLISNILISESTEKRSWYVARTLRIAKLLGRENLALLHAKLLSYLDPSTSLETHGRVSEELDDFEDTEGEERLEPWIEAMKVEILGKGGANLSRSATSPSATGSVTVGTDGDARTPAYSSISSPDSYQWPR